MKKILSIAGSDCSGGAGIEADLKTITCHGMYGMTAVTALTAQNTIGVFAIQETDPGFLSDQLDAVFTDIFPDAVKIGMTGSAALVRVIASKLKQYNPNHIVLDPVMSATSGNKLMKADTYETFLSELLPLADVITPNIPEAERLSSLTVHSLDDMKLAAQSIRQFYPGNILIKGGHLKHQADDLLRTGDRYYTFRGEHIASENTHGTGCTLSSSIACHLADGKTVIQSIDEAKSYITAAIKAGLNLGAGNGPLMHNFQLKY